MKTFSWKFKILAVINSLLLIAILAGMVFSPERKQGRTERRSFLSDKVEIGAIDIGGKQPVRLSKAGNAWGLMRGNELLPADAGKVSAFVNALRSVKSMEAVAREKAAWPEFGLEGEESRRVTIASPEGLKLAEFVLGKYSSGSSDVYIAFPDSDSAYKASSSFVSYMDGGETAWLDLRLFPSVDAKSIESLEARGTVAFDDKTVLATDYSLVRDQDGWKGSTAGGAVIAAASIDSSKVETMLRALVYAKGEDFAEPGAEMGAARATLTVRLSNGDKVSLYVGSVDADKRFLARVGEDGRLVYVASWALREAVKPVTELMRK